jgi:predicted MFS family arabinose efflux permease
MKNIHSLSKQANNPHVESTFRALQYRNFRLFWFGQILSLCGFWMQIVAKGWLILRLTDSAFALGYITFLGMLPALPVALISGAIIDRVPKRHLIIATQIGLFLQALLLALLTWTNLVQVWHLILLEGLLGILGVLDQPARQSFVIELVGDAPADLSNAIALNSVVFNGARALGPALGGLILLLVGEAACFLINALTYLPVIAGLLLIRIEDRAAESAKKTLGRSMLDGFQYLYQQPLQLGLLSLMAITGLFGTSYMYLMPVFARDILQVGEEGLGFLSAAMGVGAVLGSFAVARLEDGQRGRWLTAGSLLFPLALILFATSQQFGLSLLILVLAGSSFIIQQALVNTLIQLLVEDRMRGRVMSIYSLLFIGLQQVGALVAGGVAQLWSASLAVTGGALICLICALALLLRFPAIRRGEIKRHT